MADYERGFADGEAESVKRIADLERQLAEAQLALTDLAAEKARATLYGKERDALKATLARVEASEAEIEQSIAALFPDEFPLYRQENGGDGVSRCVGEHVPVSLVAYLCRRFKEQHTMLEHAREALVNITKAFFEFASAAVSETDGPIIPKNLAGLYDVLIRRAQAAQHALAALDAGKE